MDLPVILLACGLAAVLGFSAHRAGICTVKAVAEIATTRRFHMLASFARSTLWVIAVTAILTRLFAAPPLGQILWPLDWVAFLGGFVFGVGAAVNTACTFSTLTGLASGRLGFLVTIAGLALGIAFLVSLQAAGFLPSRSQGVVEAGQTVTDNVAVFSALMLWGAWEALRIWRGRPRPSSFGGALLAPVYRLSTAAALIGIANGLLFFFVGNWVVTAAIDDSVHSAMGQGPGADSLVWLLFVTLLAGMSTSALHRRSFRIRVPTRREATRHLLGGALMGVGAAMAPGGNATLLLNYIPSFSPHAIPAYLAILLGIAAAFSARALLGLPLPHISCAGDICDTEIDGDRVSGSRSG